MALGAGGPQGRREIPPACVSCLLMAQFLGTFACCVKQAVNKVHCCTQTMVQVQRTVVPSWTPQLSSKGLLDFVHGQPCPGWSVQMICHDYLHVVDLTICPEVSASCLIELIEQGVFGPVGLPADERLRRAYCMFIKACRANKVSALSVLIGGLNVVSYMHDTFLTSLDCLQEAGAWFGRCYFDAATNHLL